MKFFGESRKNYSNLVLVLVFKKTKTSTHNT